VLASRDIFMFLNEGEAPIYSKIMFFQQTAT